MRQRKVIIQNEPRVIIVSPVTTKSRIRNGNTPWKFVISNIIPIVNADTPPGCPVPPNPRIKFTDLPLYVPILPLCETEKPKAHEVKLLHRKVYPYVSECRKQLFDDICIMLNPICEQIRKVIDDTVDKKNKFKEYMRHDDNLLMRQAVLVSGTAAGFILGSRKYITKRIFWGIIGALFTGWLCFPKESDIAVREISYKLATILALLVSKFCNKTFKIENDRVPCFKNICEPTNEYYKGNEQMCKQKEAANN